MKTVKCSNCGYENRADARFCHKCGAVMISNPGSPDTARRQTKPLTLPASNQPTTHPLAEASVGFAPLPVGALLHDGQYTIEEVRSSDEHLNLYLVEDSTPVRICPNCRAEIDDPEEQFCSACGADISHIEPLYIRYLMQESSDEQAFAAERQLLAMQLEHPGLILPHAVFTESPYGPQRNYLVEDEFSPPLAASLPLPQELPQVLKWGIGLAQALAHLHRHQIALRQISLNNIAVEGKSARWTNLRQAHVLPPNARSMAASNFAQDVQGLAAAILYLATGEQRTTRIQLPERTATVFSQALTAPEKLSAADLAASLEEALQELRRPASLTLLVGRRTDVGQERSLNEDSLLTLDSAMICRSRSTPVGLFAVADGMGGHEAGDVASRVAVQAIAQQAISGLFAPVAAGEPLPQAHQWLSQTCLAANKSVYDHRRAAGTDMGTTLVMALVVGNQATIANVGDSRAYLLNQAGIRQISTDHSLVERLVATGQITRQEAAHHPQKNVIYRVIGDKPHTEVDLYDQRMEIGEAVLLCSDGLSGMVEDEQMWQIWRDSASPQAACDRLVQAANDAGGEDNITVVIVQVVK